MTVHSRTSAEALVHKDLTVAAILGETLSPQLITKLEELLRAGAALFEGIDPNLDPDAILNRAAQLGRWVERARDHDDTPLLQHVPDRVTAEPLEVLWLDLFAALIEHTKRTMAHGVTWVPRPPDVMLLSRAIDEGMELVERVRIAIDRSGVQAEQSAALRERILGSRAISRSRAGMKLELGHIRVNIEETPVVPPALRILIPALRMGKAHLTSAVEGKRLPSRMKQYSPEVHIAVLALLLAMDEFLSWAAGTATMSRLNTFRRIIAPRHRADGTPVHRLDPDAPAEEGEVVDPTPDDDEQDGPPSPSDDLVTPRNARAAAEKASSESASEGKSEADSTDDSRSGSESASAERFGEAESKESDSGASSESASRKPAASSEAS